MHLPAPGRPDPQPPESLRTPASLHTIAARIAAAVVFILAAAVFLLGLLVGSCHAAPAHPHDKTAPITRDEIDHRTR